LLDLLWRLLQVCKHDRLDCPFRMPVASAVVTLLIVFRGGTMGACRQLMLFDGLAV